MMRSHSFARIVLLILSGIGNVLGQNGLIVEGFVDTSACLFSLTSADFNGDGDVDSEEYVSFVLSRDTSGRLSEIRYYEELPLVMQATFVTLACLCRDARFGGDPNDTTCCLGDNASISAGAPTNTGERTMVFATCFLTDQAISQVISSESPSYAPTETVTMAPTLIPTFLPTLAPTGMPSAPTTPQPTLTPGSPTPQPTTPFPTVSPTTSPPTSSSPTPSPTSLPPTSVSPTLSPTSGEPTAIVVTPSAPPTVPPTTAGVLPLSARALVEYEIATSSTNIFGGEYINDLVLAMDRLAPEVALEVFSIRVRRKLQVVTVQLPTSITNLQPLTCPSNLVGNQYRCEYVVAEVILLSISPADPRVVEYQRALLQAIRNGRLQDALDGLNSMSTVTVLTGMQVNALEQGLEERDGGLPSGATAGIVIAALAAAILPLGLYLAMRRRHDTKPTYDIYEAEEPPQDLMEKNESMMYKNIGTSGSGGGPSPGAGIGAIAVDDEQEMGMVGGTLGAQKPNYGKPEDIRDAMEESNIEETLDIAPDSSSNAGSSGWSSSAGMSSLNTGSADDSMDAAAAAGASLAVIGAASGITRRMEKSSEDEYNRQTHNVPTVSRADLDSAIEAGDWAAVGATAALLAAASDSQSAGDTSTGKSGATSVSSIDAARAAELDHLVDAGDWEGVVLAAAKFEAAESNTGEGSVRSGTVSSNRTGGTGGTGGTGSSGNMGSSTGSGTQSGTYDRSVSTSMSESASKAQKRAEIRQEVVALVERVVPEEMDNVDEMMLQFKGREEELVETLRTMQERAVAQKARAAGHKAAKVEARRSVQRGVVPGARPPPGENARITQQPTGAQQQSSPYVDTAPAQTTELFSVPVVSADDQAAPAPPVRASTLSGARSSAAQSPPAVSKATATAAQRPPQVPAQRPASMSRPPVSPASLTRPPTSPSQRARPPSSVASPATDVGSASVSGSEISARQMRTALELAIEAGDWDAVGEAAAMMSDASVTSGSTGGSTSRSASGPFSAPSSGSRGVRVSGVNASRARELDEMIDRGDWSGVVAAAGRFSQADKSQNSSGGSSDREKTSSTQETDSRSRRLREEADALAQAEIWMAIAEQSKVEGATDVGASDAADWAIARSLSRLRQAERTGDSGMANARQSPQEFHDTREEDESV